MFFMSVPGQLTSAVAKSITEEINKRGFDIYYDHGEKGEFVGTIAVSIEKELSSEKQISQLDIAVVGRDTNKDKVIALIEIEETTDTPKTLIGDVFTTLMGNSVHLPGRNKIAEVGKWTTLIVLGKGERHDERIKQINKIVNIAKLDFGTGNSQIGNIVIESFSHNEKLEKIIMDHIDEAIRRSA
jgi:hypothetical protein